MLLTRSICVVGLTLLASGAWADSPQHSLLWGRDGERWQPDSRLPDFSYAGYYRGEKPLPTLEGQECQRLRRGR